MLRTIVQASLRQPFLVLALAAALLLLGYRNLRNAPLDVFPEFAPPLVEIQTEAPGLSTEEVESLVTVPLENALNGTPNLKTIRSKSVLGLSSIVLIFQEGTDLMESRQLVGERLAIEASRLPAVAQPPVILSPLSSTSRVLKIGIWSDKDADGKDVMSQMDMTELARWTIRPRLMAVSGVANVAIWGQRDRQYQVLVDPERLRAHSMSLTDVERAAGDAAHVAGGGFVDTPNQRLPVRHVSTIVTADDLARTVVAFRDGAPIRLGDVAVIQEGYPPPIGDAIINDVPGLLLIVEKQPTGNTLDVTRNVEAALEEMKPGLKGVQVDSTIFRPATFIEMSLENLGWSMVIGCVLVVVILVAFLWDWRTALISTTAIPLSLVAAALVLRQGWCHDQHDGAGRPDHRAGRGRGRCDHRRREHRPASATQSRGRLSAIGVSRGSGRVDRSAKRGRLRQLYRDAGHHARVLSGGPGRIVSSDRWPWPTCWRSSPRWSWP